MKVIIDGHFTINYRDNPQHQCYVTCWWSCAEYAETLRSAIYERGVDITTPCGWNVFFYHKCQMCERGCRMKRAGAGCQSGPVRYMAEVPAAESEWVKQFLLSLAKKHRLKHDTCPCYECRERREKAVAAPAQSGLFV